MEIEKAKTYQPKKILNLGVMQKDGKVLLAMKKRGFGVGWWNGYGGKVEEGETIEDSLRREIKEESGVDALKLEQKGKLWFEFEGDSKILEVHAFQVVEWSGEPKETDEMRPQWFPMDKVPFDSMWPGDDQWMPYLLSGKHFEGSLLFTPEKKLISCTIVEVNDESLTPVLAPELTLDPQV